MSLSEAQREIAETSGPAQLGAFTLMATQKLSVADRKKLAIDTVKDLSEQDKKDVVAGLGSPDQDATDFIWKLVVGVFSLILVGAVFVLGLGRFMAVTPATGAIYTPTDTIVTVFTTSSAFLIGLLVPSPVNKK